MKKLLKGKNGLLAPISLFLFCFSQASFAQLRYDKEYPAVGYSTAVLSDPVSELMTSIDAGTVELKFEEERGYLDSLLEVLEIDPSSQLLVFSKSALKKRFVSPQQPRAIYFNDDTYVAFIPGSRSLEISAMDPAVGPVFFTLDQNPDIEPATERHLNRCLRCHDGYSLSGGGVPRFLLSSVLAGADGEIVSHELSTITNTSTPLNRRWGGMYVTGLHGSQEHMGNLIIDDLAMLSNLNLSERGNRSDLSEFLDVSPYIAQHSDIVALLVIEHQAEVQNAFVKATYPMLTLIDKEGSISQEQIQEMTEPLLRSLLMADEVGLSDEVTGFSGFSEYFQAQGPFDSKGRSLRDLDLKTRTFKYPLSYLIYSKAFDALPIEAVTYLYKRLQEILTNTITKDEFSHLSIQDRVAILEILEETKPGFPH